MCTWHSIVMKINWRIGNKSARGRLKGWCYKPSPTHPEWSCSNCCTGSKLNIKSKLQNSQYHSAIVSLSGIENFVSERDNFILNSFRNFKPVKRFQNRSDVLEFWSLYNSSSKSILDVLETVYSKFRKTVVNRVTVVKLGVYDGGGNCFGGVKVKVGTDIAKITDIMIAGFRQRHGSHECLHTSN